MLGTPTVAKGETWSSKFGLSTQVISKMTVPVLLCCDLSLCCLFFRLFYNIRKTCPCNEYPLKPHFYIVKLGYAGVYLFYLFLLQNIDCGYSLEPPPRRF